MDFLKKDQLPGSSSMKSALNSNVWALWTIRIILVIYASFVAPNLNKGGALFFNNMIVRLVIAVLIVYLCYVDPCSAILLAVCFVVSVQTLNKYRIASISDDPVDSFAPVDSFMNPDNSSPMGEMPPPMGEMPPPEERENFYQNSNTSEENSQVMSEDPNMFTSQEQLSDAQTNQVQNDQVSQVQTWREQLGPQGLNAVHGFNIDNDTDPLKNAAQF